MSSARFTVRPFPAKRSSISRIAQGEADDWQQHQAGRGTALERIAALDVGRHVDGSLHGRDGRPGSDHRSADHSCRPRGRHLGPELDGRRVRTGLRSRRAPGRRARRPLRAAGVPHRAGPVHPRLGWLRPQPERRPADRCPSHPGRRRRARRAPVTRADQRGLPTPAACPGHRDLGGDHRHGGRCRPAGRRSHRVRHRLAVDFLGQRAHRRRRTRRRPHPPRPQPEGVGTYRPRRHARRGVRSRSRPPGLRPAASPRRRLRQRRRPRARHHGVF